MASEVVVRRDTLPGGEPFDWINESGQADGQVLSTVREIAAQVSEWVGNQRAVRHKASMFNRTAYSVPDTPYAQFLAARDAVRNDDIVGGIADVTEAMMFDGLKMEGPDPDDADIFNQIAADLDLDEFTRKCHRELFTYSQVCVAEWWGLKTYTVRGYTLPTLDSVPETPTPDQNEADPAVLAAADAVTADATANARKGRKRKRKYELFCPTRLAILDSTKVVPVGGTPFGIERLAWHATQGEMVAWDKLDAGLLDDPIMMRLFMGKYTATIEERIWMSRMGINPDLLLELNPAYVWRHTYTKPDYEGWADVRLKGTFQWLDLKQQQMEADRAMLVGAANYILLIKKGEKENPAHPEELTNLREGFKVLAKLPVIVSDHRLEIEIITPKLDNTLDQARYDTIDRRIMGRALGSLSIASSGQRNENTLTISQFIGRTLESRRHMLKRVIESRIVKAVVDSSANAKAGFKSEPNMAFVPARISLGSDQAVVNQIAAARASRDLSRESYLEFLGFDQEIEAQRMELEAVRFDPIFKTQVPFSATAGGDQQTGPNGEPIPAGSQGAAGGRPAGGGQPPANAGKPKGQNPTPEPKGPAGS